MGGDIGRGFKDLFSGGQHSAQLHETDKARKKAKEQKAEMQAQDEKNAQERRDTAEQERLSSRRASTILTSNLGVEEDEKNLSRRTLMGR